MPLNMMLVDIVICEPCQGTVKNLAKPTGLLNRWVLKSDTGIVYRERIPFRTMRSTTCTEDSEQSLWLFCTFFKLHLKDNVR